MTEYIDTHAHVYEPEFDADREDVMKRAAEAGVERLLLPAIDRESYDRMLEMCDRWPDRCFPMMGLHPTSVNDNPRWQDDLTLVAEYLERHNENRQNDKRFCAVGEIGLDYYWSREFCPQQREAFERQIDMSLRHGLPIAVHVRDAKEDTIAILRNFERCGVRGVLHAYSGSAGDLDRVRRCGDFLFGVGGVVTFRKSTLGEAVREMELSEIVLETDCPYLTPAPHRGKRNEPAYIPYICSRIAELKGVAAEDVAAAATANAERMFLQPK